jgi:RNA polymerase subunit RPABC4/transcription elongation factor Spt4
MEDILKSITDTIGGIFDNPIVQFGLKAILAYCIILWLAAAYWAFRDMQLRSENPILPYLASALIVLFTPILFVFGVVVYRIVRPQEKIGEIYERNLAEEALLAEVESVKTCPACHRRIHDEWIICPGCRSRLNRVCSNCGRLVGLDWSLCAWCGKDFERTDIAAYQPISAGLDDLAQLPAVPAASTASATSARPGPRPNSQRTPRPSSGRSGGPGSKPGR